MLLIIIRKYKLGFKWERRQKMIRRIFNKAAAKRSQSYNQPQTSVAQLGFENQVALWSLRATLKGPDYAARAERQFRKTLPGASARLAIDSINDLITAIYDHGIAALRFNCLCQAGLTADEQRLMAFFQITQTDTLFETREAARQFVHPHGVDEFVNAALMLFAALETRHSHSENGVTSLALSTTLH
jgi:hypothetical protein